MIIFILAQVIRESGPPHMKTFVTRCKVGDMETESEGNSKKVSKKKAAELMLEKLKELPALPPSVIRPRTKISKKKNKNIIKVGPVFSMLSYGSSIISDWKCCEFLQNLIAFFAYKILMVKMMKINR